jgi:poly(3-hydroxybutyrate) depolymerase
MEATMTRYFLTILILMASVMLSFTAAAVEKTGVEKTEGPLQCAMGRDYWLGFPHGYDASKTYWLVVAVHGAGGNGDGMKNYTLAGPRTDYIVVAPTFPDSNSAGYYQTLGGEAGKQLVDLFQALKKKYRLHEKLFLYGFSGGSQFSHRFTMTYPELVIGCSAHSGGTWGPEMNLKAIGIPLFYSCGLADIDSSRGGLPPRIVEAENYFTEVQKKGFMAKMRYWEGVAHSTSPKISPLTAECFEIATTGFFPSQQQAWNAEVEKVAALIAAGSLPEAKKAMTALAKFKIPAAATKAEKWMSLTKPQQEEKRKTFVGLGIGGKSELGRDFWINDSYENEYGYQDIPATRAAQAQGQQMVTIKQTITELKEKLKAKEKELKDAAKK